MATENTCAVEKRGRVYVITLTGEGEHRLNPALLSAIRAAVATVRADPGGAGALVLAAEGKFFSNGGDLAWAGTGTAPADRLLAYRAALRGLVADLLALPVPTVAAVTGHTAGAGCALALAHDAIVVRASRGFLYMSEVDAGIKIDFVGEVLRQKVPDAVARRDLVMKGDKMTAVEAVRRGIVDAVVDGGVEDVVAAAVAMAEELAGRGWDGENLANIRKATWAVLWSWSKVKDYGGEAPARPRL
jgi:enoyl-CoA hydratase/carnithine racemase